MSLKKLKIVMEEVTDPSELAQAQAQQKQFDQNWAWFKARADEGGFMINIPCEEVARVYDYR